MLIDEISTRIQLIICIGSLCALYRLGHAVDEGIHQVGARGLGVGDVRFELVAERHQLIHLGNDAFLLGEWWEWYFYTCLNKSLDML
jgi:hypothetical protein